MSEIQENDDLVASLKTRLGQNKQFSSECCIYRIPERIYHGNRRAYTPKVVSIGPIHHREEALKPMEEQKFLYLESFLERTGLSVEDYANFAKQREETVRKLYAERFEKMKTREFVEMIVLDVAFVVEILFRNHLGVKDQRDRLFQKPMKVVDVRYDLMLLENQIPYFLLEDIFELAKLSIRQDQQFNIVIGNSLSVERISLIQLTHKFFRFKAYMGERGCPDDLLTRMTQHQSKITHFVDFFRKFHVPKNVRSKTMIKTLTVPSATKLYEAGVDFEVGPTKDLFDINFRGKTLVIPLLRVRRSMESFFLNVLAYEQLHMLEHYVNDYVFVLDRLVDSSKAVDLLTRKGLIETKLADHQDVVASIDSIVRGSILRREHFHFNELCDGLNKHLSNQWNKRLATIKHTHFSSPLTAFYVLVAASIFVLSLMQTICSCGVPFK